MKAHPYQEKTGQDQGSEFIAKSDRGPLDQPVNIKLLLEAIAKVEGSPEARGAAPQARLHESFGGGWGVPKRTHSPLPLCPPTPEGGAQYDL
jgi:hypothetical protein